MTDSPHNLEETMLSSQSDVINFLQEYCDFSAERAYVLLAIARPKENRQLSANKNPVIRDIITKESEITPAVSKLCAGATAESQLFEPPLTFRLYITVNARDVQKAFFQFQKQTINLTKNHINGHHESTEKMAKMHTEWYSTLQQKGNKDNDYFLIDIDTKDQDTVNDIEKSLKKHTTVHTKIETPNGYHLVVSPFGYPQTILPKREYVDIKTDDSLFLWMV